MSIAVSVTLLSGRARVITLSPDCTVEDLRLEAQLSLKVGLERLVTESGVILHGKSTLRAANLQNGATVTAHVRQAQLVSSALAFALLRPDGTVVTWGNAIDGGDSSAVQDELKDVNQIQSSLHAFAAIRSDGSVVTWGKSDDGGNSSAVQHQLRDVKHIQASSRAFAAIRADGSVIAWGNPRYGGDCSKEQDQLRDVTQIQASRDTFGASFAAVCDGRVVTWGDTGGDSSSVRSQLKDVVAIQATTFGGSFAALKSDGSVVCWGSPTSGGDSSAVQDQLFDVHHIQATESAFAAIRGDGVVVCWGNPQEGGDCADVQEQLIDVKHVQATTKAFAAIRADKTVVTWGSGSYGGDSSEVQDQLKNVEYIQAASLAFAALKSDGSVVTWGTPDAGGDSSCVQDQLHDVTRIQVSRDGVRCSFAAIRQDGKVVTWGDPSSGGCCRMVRDQLFDVQEIQGTENCFAAIRSDGGVVTWGNGDFAPDCYTAQELLQDGNLSGLSGLFPAGYAAIGSDGSVVNFGGTFGMPQLPEPQVQTFQRWSTFAATRPRRRWLLMRCWRVWQSARTPLATPVLEAAQIDSFASRWSRHSLLSAFRGWRRTSWQALRSRKWLTQRWCHKGAMAAKQALQHLRKVVQHRSSRERYFCWLWRRMVNCLGRGHPFQAWRCWSKRRQAAQRRAEVCLAQGLQPLLALESCRTAWLQWCSLLRLQMDARIKAAEALRARQGVTCQRSKRRCLAILMTEVRLAKAARWVSGLVRISHVQHLMHSWHDLWCCRMGQRSLISRIQRRCLATTLGAWLRITQRRHRAGPAAAKLTALARQGRARRVLRDWLLATARQVVAQRPASPAKEVHELKQELAMVQQRVSRLKDGHRQLHQEAVACQNQLNAAEKAAEMAKTEEQKASLEYQAYMETMEKRRIDVEGSLCEALRRNCHLARQLISAQEASAVGEKRLEASEESAAVLRSQMEAAEEQYMAAMAILCSETLRLQELAKGPSTTSMPSPSEWEQEV
eukprot:s2276_g3.t1